LLFGLPSIFWGRGRKKRKKRGKGGKKREKGGKEKDGRGNGNGLSHSALRVLTQTTLYRRIF